MAVILLVCVTARHQCRLLFQTSAVDNDGYNHKGALQSPHTEHEAFSGLTLDRTAQVRVRSSQLDCSWQLGYSWLVIKLDAVDEGAWA